MTDAQNAPNPSPPSHPCLLVFCDSGCGSVVGRMEGVMDLETLARRIKDAEGPDRELDREIGLAIGGWKAGSLYGHKTITVGNDTSADHPGGMYPSPTESIDAAVSILEKAVPGVPWKMYPGQGSYEGRFCVSWPKNGDEFANEWVDAATRLLALCLCAISYVQLRGW